MSLMYISHLLSVFICTFNVHLARKKKQRAIFGKDTRKEKVLRKKHISAVPDVREHPTPGFTCLNTIMLSSKTMEGNVYIDSNTKTVDGRDYHTQMSQDTLVDETIRKVYVNQTISLNGGPEYLQQVYQDFSTGLQYVIKGGACIKMNVSSSEPSCIPKNAEVVTKSFIGSGKTALKATMYHFTRDNLDVHLTMADDGCIPVLVKGNGITQTGENIKMAAEYMGIVVAPMNVSILIFRQSA